MVKSKVKNLQSLLSTKLGNHTKIINQQTTLLTAPGEHYGSIMLALTITTTTSEEPTKEKTFNLVAKLIPANEMLRLAFDIPVTFRKEVFAYTETIPALTHFQKTFNTTNTKLFETLFPACYGARICLDANKNEVDEDAILIFENLKLLGYKTEDRLVGFDLAAARIILEDLAKFHAIPIAAKLLNHELFKSKVLPALEKNKGLEQLPEEVGLAFHNSIMDGAGDIPELEPFLERLQKVVDYAAEHPYVNRPPPNEPWGTMAHSDFWVSNTMLLRDGSGAPIANKIVDLQIMSYTSAVRDLVFFLFTSVINNVLEKHFDELLQTYYESFVGVLRQFGIDPEPQFSWQKFLKEVDEVAPTETYHILVMLKPIFTERGKVQNSLEDFQDTDWSRKDLLGGEHRRKLKNTVLELVKRNWI